MWEARSYITQLRRIIVISPYILKQVSSALSSTDPESACDC